MFPAKKMALKIGKLKNNNIKNKIIIMRYNYISALMMMLCYNCLFHLPI